MSFAIQSLSIHIKTAYLLTKRVRLTISALVVEGQHFFSLKTIYWQP